MCQISFIKLSDANTRMYQNSIRKDIEMHKKHLCTIYPITFKCSIERVGNAADNTDSDVNHTKMYTANVKGEKAFVQR